MKAETKYKGSIKLSAIGDALGWLTEFEKSTKSIKEKYGTEKIEDFYNWDKIVGGRFYGFKDAIRAGSYSDDTQLMLCVARSLTHDGRVENNYFSKIELANWLFYARGGGRTIKIAADKISSKSVKWYNNFFNYKINETKVDYRESGANGAAMRVLPIALANLGDFEKIKEEIFCNSIITHGHPRALIGAILFGYAINQIILFRPENFNWESFITQIGIDFKQKFSFSFMHIHEIEGWLKEWNKDSQESFETIYNQTLDEVQNQLRAVYLSLKNSESLFNTLKKLGCFDNKTKGSGTATVLAGIFIASKYSDKPVEGIIEAVNTLGTDTDSIAAFTGGLLGALHGQSIIPNKWKEVQDYKYLDLIAERLLAISEDRLKPNDLLKFKSKYIPLENPVSEQMVVGDEIDFIPLGKGIITAIDRQATYTKGKYNSIFEINFNVGQSCVFSKLFDKPVSVETLGKTTDTQEQLLKLAAIYLKPETLQSFETYINKQKKISKGLLKVFNSIIRNEK